MMMPKRIDELRHFYARLVTAIGRSGDQRLIEAFAFVPREAFLPEPWLIGVGTSYLEVPSADPAYIYQNVLVALDADQQVNNGEPGLHAAWMSAAGIGPGDAVVHIGSGTGYYSAIMSILVAPGGSVSAYEIDDRIASWARENLQPYGNVTVSGRDGVKEPLPKADVIYVNAGVVAPPVAWLNALQPGGRLIFPWRPAEMIGIAALVTRMRDGFALTLLMPSWFIPCSGASEAEPGATVPDYESAWRAKSIRLVSQEAPDETACAVYSDVWFSSKAIGGPESEGV